MIGLCPSSVTLDGKEYYVKYENGRAEFALGRMYEDGKLVKKSWSQLSLRLLQRRLRRALLILELHISYFGLKIC